MSVREQITAILRSRKAWATFLSLVATGVAFSYHTIDAQTAILADSCQGTTGSW